MELLDCGPFKYPIELVQDTEEFEGQCFVRRMFVDRSAGASIREQPYELLDDHQSTQTAKKCKIAFLNQDNIFGAKFGPLKVTYPTSNEEVLLRVMSGLSGYTEWMNEMQVYLLPDFKHKNILDSFGCKPDEWRRMPSIAEVASRLKVDDRKQAGCSTDQDQEQENNQDHSFQFLSMKPTRVEYWLANKFQCCILLKDYLKAESISWRQMIRISIGIAEGIHYLHEHSEYMSHRVKAGATGGFVRSTGHAIKKVAFECRSSVLYLKPYYNLSVVHRNLSSSSIVIRVLRSHNQQEAELHPMIWNFNLAHVYHPFQPTNLKQYLPSELKDSLRLSAYSAPEVLVGQTGSLTLQALKSVDMYALGVIYWEMMTRCRLPRLDRANPLEHRQRSEPRAYREPFEVEFSNCFEEIKRNSESSSLDEKILIDLLEDSIVYRQCRPTIKNFWLIGRKTYMLVQMIMDLWDENWDARLHVTTVLDRLSQLNALNLNSDKRIKRVCKQFRSNFYYFDSYWPIKKFSTQTPVRPERVRTCMKFKGSSPSE